MTSKKYFHIGRILCREYPELARKIASGIVSNYDVLNKNVANLYKDFQEHEANEDQDRLYIFLVAANKIYGRHGVGKAIANAVGRSQKRIYEIWDTAQFRYRNNDNFKTLTDNFLNQFNDEHKHN